ncbi:MAG: hypothetical protein AAFY37_00480 [Pseudomonadota bacterium]
MNISQRADTRLPSLAAVAAGVGIALFGLVNSAAADTLPMSWVPPSGMEPGPIDGTEALLHRSSAGISAQLRTTGLTPGHVVTLWVVAIQNPDLCAANPCSPVEAMGEGVAMNTVAINGGGAVVDAEGAVRISSFLPSGAVTGNMFDSNLDAPETTEVHLVLHDHGPIIAGEEADMLGSYRGGCTDESIPPYYPASAMTDGLPGPNSCNTAQVALFVPSDSMN